MALQFTPLPLLFTGGLDTKSDPKAVSPGKLAELENAVFTKTGILSKRYGYDILTRTIQGGASSISAAKAITVFGDELILYTGTRAYSYAEGTQAWQDRGAVVSLATDVKPVIHNSYSQSNPDSAINNGVRVTAWEDSRGGVRCSAQDVVTGTFYLADVVVSATGQKPRVVAFGPDLVIFYTGTAAASSAFNLFYRRIVAVTPTALAAEVNPIATLVNTNAANNYDVAVVGARLFVGWNDSGTATARLSYLDSTYTLATPVAGPWAGTNCVALVPYSTTTSGVVLCAAENTNLKIRAFTYTLAIFTPTIGIEAVVGVKRITGVLPSGTPTLTLLYEVQPLDASSNPDPDNDHRIVRFVTIDTVVGTVSSPADFKRSVGIASRGFDYAGTGYAMLVHSGNTDARSTHLQNTYFLADVAGNITARVAPGDAGGLRTQPTLPDVLAASTGVYEVAGVTTGKLVSVNGDLYALPGVSVAQFDYVSSQTYQSAKLGNNLITAGGVVQAYDGLQFAEAGFHLYPEAITADQTAMTIAVTTQGTGAVAEVTSITCIAGNRLTGGQYFTLYSATDAIAYYLWITVDGVGIDPAPAAKTGIACALLSTDTATQVATKIAAALDPLAAFIATSSGPGVTCTNAAIGATTDAANGPTTHGLGAGSIANSTYQYVAIYERTDHYGQVVRSAGSIPLTVVVAAANSSVTITVPTLRITGHTTPARVVLYRTQGLTPLVFYRLNALATPLLNSTTADSVTFCDTQTDLAISTNEILYTVGGVLDAEAPPASTLVTTYRNRILLAGQANPNQISYSTITVPNEAVYFSSELTLQVDPRGGAITALGVLDDKCIVFKETAIFAFAGDGPTNTGAQNDYGDPVLIASDVGCNNANSIVQTANGLMFQSPKGLYLLDRSLQAHYIGDAVESHNGTAISGAAMVPNTNQIRFLSSGGPALVYDYLFDQWATFTNHEAVDCDVWRGEFVFVRPTGEVYVENRTKWTDGGDRYIKLKITTAWFQTSGLQGYQRCQRIYVLGDYRGTHSLRVRVGYNFDPVYVQDQTFNAGTIIGSATYGSGSPYGWAGSSVPGVYGGTTELEQFGVHIARQKCQAIRVSVEDTQPSEYNEGVAINGITLLVGAKSGLHKLPATKRA